VELVESFVDFARMLHHEEDAIHSLILNDVRYYVLEPEPEAFLCIGVSTHEEVDSGNTSGQQSEAGIASRLYWSIAGGSTSAGQGSEGSISSSSSRMVEPSEHALRTILMQTASAVRFLVGSFGSRLALGNEAVNRLRTLLRKVLRWYLGLVCFETISCGAIHEMDGVEHLTLEKPVFLQVQSFVELFATVISAPFAPKVLPRKSIILQNGTLAWSSLPHTVSRSIIRHISRLGVLDYSAESAASSESRYINLGEYHQQVLDGTGVAGNSSGFVTIGHEGSRLFAPIVYLGLDDSSPTALQPVRMVALKAERTVFVFFLRVDESIQCMIDSSPSSSWDVDFHALIKAEEIAVADILKKIQTSIRAHLERLCGLLGESYKLVMGDVSGNTVNKDPVFILYNPLNLVIKATPRYQKWAKINDSMSIQRSELPMEVLHAWDVVRLHVHRAGRLLTDIGADDDDLDGYAAVVSGNWCIVGWRSGGRELYAFESLNKVLGSYYYGASTLEVHLVLDKLQARLNDIVQKKFQHVLLL